MTKSYVDDKKSLICDYKKPLMYNGASDLSILPITKDSLGVCPQCGAVAIKHAYNGKLSKFCSLKCSRRFNASQTNNNGTHQFKLIGTSDHLVGMIPMEPLPQLESPWPVILEDLMQPSPTKTPLVASSYEWSSELFGCDFLAAPVKLFKHAPLSSMWDNTFEGMKVEVRNMDCYSERQSDFFWVATVMKVKGYMALLRYEGFGSDDSRDFWLNLCCSEVHPVGWCATRGKPLIPPASIEDKYSDWKRFLVRQLTGARTLPADFYSKLSEGLKSRFKIGTVMEVVDKNRISQVKVASIYEIVGKRLHVKYYDTSSEDHGFWCHEDSPLIHPVGWAFTVGHVLDAPPDYCERVASGILESSDATPDMFYHPEMEQGVELFQDGQKLEAIDPLNLSSVCAATVMRVLHDGFMMIRIDCYPADASGADWFCYHQRSPCIFPVGFTKANNIPLIPPAGYNARTFEWSSYLEESRAVAAGPELFPPRSAALHGFVSGMRLECSDLMDPRLVCVATIARVIGNLLKIHFDGWGEEYDQWLSGDSTDIYPVGWCRAVGHRLEGPLRPTPPPRAPRRPRTYKRKRNQTQLAQGQPRSPFIPPVSESTSSESTQPSDDARVSGSMADDVSSVVRVDSSETVVMADSEHSSQSSTTQSSNDLPRAEEHDDQQAMEICKEQTVSDEIMSVKDKVIPRLVGKSDMSPETLRSMEPDKWSAAEVAEFLKVNDWAAYCVNFQEVDGSRLLALTKDKIIELLEMKVGPSLKIFDLIQQLKSKVKPMQNRRKIIEK